MFSPNNGRGPDSFHSVCSLNLVRNLTPHITDRLRSCDPGYLLLINEGAIFIDLKRAFGTVDPFIILKKTKPNGFISNLSQLFPELFNKYESLNVFKFVLVYLFRYTPWFSIRLYFEAGFLYL